MKGGAAYKFLNSLRNSVRLGQKKVRMVKTNFVKPDHIIILLNKKVKEEIMEETLVRRVFQKLGQLNVIGGTGEMFMSAFRLGKTVKKDGGQVAWKKMKDGEDGSREQLDKMTNLLLDIRDAVNRGNFPPRDGKNGGRKGNGNGNGNGEESNGNGDGMIDV